MIDELTPVIDQIIFTSSIIESRKRSRRWTDKEDEFLRKSLGYLMESEIGILLERSENGVKMRREKLNLPASSKITGWITANRARKWLGLNDGRRIIDWTRKGMIRGHIMGGPRKICMMGEISFMMFVVNPMNWPWFDINKVTNLHLRRLIARQKERWGDEWITSKQATKITGLDVRQIHQYVRMGRLTNVHTWNRDGRFTQKGRWANYYILRSEIEKLKIMGRGDAVRKETAGGLEWIRKALGMGWKATWIGRSMKLNDQTVRNWIKRYHLDDLSNK